MLKKILFITNQQFGSHTDSYKYCEILRFKYDITYLCFDKGLIKSDLDGVRVEYVSCKGNKTVRGIRFILRAVFKAAFFKGFIFVIYFKRFDYIKRLLPWKRMHVDIRTLSVNRDKAKREKIDNNIRNAVELFDSASAISLGVIKKLGSTKKIYLLPLGADIISNINKTFDNIRLLYVGTLTNRDIIKTVEGFKKYKDLHPDVDITYDIVGDGIEYNDIVEYVTKEKLTRLVSCHGWIPHGQLKQYFDHCNVGVSFVPVTDYYEYQPPTKTYEYAFSGMFTIATGTEVNKEIINTRNGIIIKDTSDDFVKSLDWIWQNRKKLDSALIRNSLANNSWKLIVENYLEPILNACEN
jgi:hypothetical protein